MATDVFSRAARLPLIKRLGQYSVLIAAHDFIASWIAFTLAYAARVGVADLAAYPDQLLLGGIIFALVCAVIYQIIGLSSTYWRFTSIVDIRLIVVASAASVLVWLALTFSITRLEMIPRSLPFILFLTEVAALAGPRILYRLVRDRRDRKRAQGQNASRIRLLLVGAPHDVFQAINWANAHAYRLEIVGILGGKQRHVGLAIQGVKFLGTPRDFSAVLDRLEAEDRFPGGLLLCSGAERLNSDELDILTTVCGIRGVRLHRSFDPEEILRRGVPPPSLSRLLGRPEAVAMPANAQETLIAGKRIFITGAGGTIGAEVARYVAAAAPARLGLLDVSEFNLYQIRRELQDDFPDVALEPILCNIRDEAIVRGVLRRFAPDIVVHAAALKHVDMVEETPREGVLTNIFGAINVAEAAAEAKAAIFVLVSTDKAVNATSVMGLTKRVGELYVSELDSRRQDAQGQGTRFISVRFGNVIGSSGSVVPLFRQQIARGGPVTVTHPDMERYFMTVREAAGLILQAAHDALLNDRRRGRVCVLEMGKPVRIVELAQQLIASSAPADGEEIKIVYTGLRPGERLSEKLFSDEEECFHTSHGGVLFAEPRSAPAPVSPAALDQLRAAAMIDDHAAMSDLLRGMVRPAASEDAASVGADSAAPAADSPVPAKVLPFKAGRPR